MGLYLRIFPILLFFSFPVLLAGCSGQGNQPVFTAKEINKFIADNPAIMKATRQAWFSKAGKVKDVNTAVMEAKKAKISELGWDVNRYFYIFSHCQAVLSYENLKEANENWKVRLQHYPQDKTARESFESTSATLARLSSEVENNIPVSERVLIIERLRALNDDFDGPVKTFGNHL